MRGNIDLTPEEFEKEVESLLRKAGEGLRDFKTQRRQMLSEPEGTYEIDITARFKAFGTEFLVLVECKRYSSPVERQVVQILHDKLRTLGAQKGILFSTSGFQKGAIAYAKKHGIAPVQLVDGRATYYSPHVPDHLRLPCIALVADIDLTETGETGSIRYRTLEAGDNNALLQALDLQTSKSN